MWRFHKPFSTDRTINLTVMEKDGERKVSMIDNRGGALIQVESLLYLLSSANIIQ